jgi:hypothetical protein
MCIGFIKHHTYSGRRRRRAIGRNFSLTRKTDEPNELIALERTIPYSTNDSMRQMISIGLPHQQNARSSKRRRDTFLSTRTSIYTETPTLLADPYLSTSTASIVLNTHSPTRSPLHNVLQGLIHRHRPLQHDLYPFFTSNPRRPRRRQGKPI